MKVELIVDDDLADRIVVGSLKETLSFLKEYDEMVVGPDRKKLIKGCKRLIKYYSTPQDVQP